MFFFFKSCKDIINNFLLNKILFNKKTNNRNQHLHVVADL